MAEEVESESWRRRVASAAFYRRAGSGAPKIARELPPFPARASLPPPLERAKMFRARGFFASTVGVALIYEYNISRTC